MLDLQRLTLTLELCLEPAHRRSLFLSEADDVSLRVVV